MKKKILMASAVIVILAAICFIAVTSHRQSAPVSVPESGGTVNAAVLYSERADTDIYQDALSLLEQSLMPNLKVKAINIDGDFSLDGLDIIYPDSSIMQSPNSAGAKNDILSFAEAGGAVFLTNDFHDFFGESFIGASEFKKIDTFPQNLKFPNIGDDYAGMQGIISDFAALYPADTTFERCSQYDYGYAVLPKTALSVVQMDGLSLYTMNRFGEGYVFFTNPLLPNAFSVTGTEMVSRNDKQVSYSATTSSANRTIYSAFAEFVSKQKYGFSLERVYGCFGRPSMAWELHFEEITGYKNNSGVLFAELAKENCQIPSYSVVRNAYTWFLRSESISYMPGEQNAGFAQDYYENAYSSGKHVVADGRWLTFTEKADGGSYFVDYPEIDLCAYPFVDDLNGDSYPDIVSGSSDGRIYLCAGTAGEGNLTVETPKPITASDGTELSVSGQSSPIFADIDGDGVRDIVCGSGSGAVYAAKGTKSGSFAPFKLLLQTGISGLCFPETGDLDADGKTDLLVGSDEGRLICYFGESATGLVFDADSPKDLSASLEGLGTWLAPRLFDLNGDGASELYIGTFDGYIAKTRYSGGALEEPSYLTSAEMNYKGNNNIKFGNNCVPFFADIDGDGVADLICGCLEYGMAYPIDSPYFPYRGELKKQLDYFRKNDLFVEPHFLTNAYASTERERHELQMHLDALESYGIPRDSLMGTNQHTWHISSHELPQSFLSAYDQGLLWNSGFEPSRSTATPQVSAENVIALPFFLTRDGKKTTLIQNNSVVLYKGDEWTDTSARYGTPVCLYYHCDFIYADDAEAKKMVNVAADFQRKHRYNFVREDQLMLASAAAQNLVISPKSADNSGKAGLDVTLIPAHISEDFPLYDERYAMSSGYKISLGDKLSGKKLAVDASVWYRDGSSFFVSADRPVRLFETDKKAEPSHLEQVNVAAEITSAAKGVRVNFLDSGMLQCVVAGKARTADAGWKIEERDGHTIFTKFGKAQTLTITY